MNPKQNPWPWAEHTITNTGNTLKIGDLQLTFKRQGADLWLGAEHSKTQVKKTLSQPPQDGCSWTRWTMRGENMKIRLTPIFPDHPVVIKPEYPFKLLKNDSAKIYVRIPLWIRVGIAGKTETKIAEIPSEILSNTWFGTPEDGELAYWLSSPAEREIPDKSENVTLANCPIEIINKDVEELVVDKLALRVERLSLFEFDYQVWANLTRVVYRGKDEVSRIDILDKSPGEAPNAKKIANARDTGKKGYAARTFYNLKDITGLDWFF